MDLTQKQIESLKIEIEKKIPLEGLSFNDPYWKFENNIEFIVLERYNHKLKLIFLVVPLQQDKQFNRFQDLERFAKEITELSDANFGYYGTYYIKNDNSVTLEMQKNPIERLK